MKKLLLLVAWVFCINCGIVMASSPDIAVAVVHGQFAAELSCEDGTDGKSAGYRRRNGFETG